MRNILYVYLVIVGILVILVFSFTILNRRNKKGPEVAISDDTGDTNIINEDDKKIIEDKKYGFDLMLDDNLYVKGSDEFIQVSNEEISNDLNSKQCVVDVVTEKSSVDVCDYIKNECQDLGCKKYTCESYKNGWYKIKEEGDFAGSGDIMFARKEGEYTYFLNLECSDINDDNENNPLIDDIINSFKYNE